MDFHSEDPPGKLLTKLRFPHDSGPFLGLTKRLAHENTIFCTQAHEFIRCDFPVPPRKPMALARSWDQHSQQSSNGAL